ncbi:arylsulfatase [Seonamhaeicola maritimus]|uniref:Arylsulfatase n=1 Tax=Seonamhaeicola maritimus TaxID=2591822 RepID=A0A5C7GLA4_9FLAO|nr:arylsulfatase [Seonamhaeicola maritimus]TXG39082.1 arylsulfatase [Seonamhaeicola maritimus]
MKKVLFLITISLGFHLFAQSKSLKNSRPNIIFVMTDDQGHNLSYEGHPVIQTPNIDKFASRSLRFKEFHVSPNCAPTRAAIMSGAHEFRSGVTHTVKERELLALTTTIFPELLKKAGYETGIFGKWHLGDIEAYRPGNRGFTESLVHGAGGIGQNYSGSNVDFPPNQNKETRYFDNVLLHNEAVVKTKGYCTDLFFHAALAWMKENHDNSKPFFSYISTNTPHSPLIAPKESYMRIEDRDDRIDKASGRWAMIENIDDNFGLLMNKLEDWGMLENTLIIFTTDNGAPYKVSNKAKNKFTFNAGFKTGKGSPYEGGVHVPAYWYWKNVLPENKETKALTAHIDLFKTFCDLAGADYSNIGQKLEGRTLIPILEDSNTKWEDRMLFTHRAGFGNDLKKASETNWAVRTQRWRLVVDKLFDISKDPYEDNDVAVQYPEVVKELTQAHFSWWDAMVPYMINQNNTWEKEAPMVTLYNQQLKESGEIPEWMPESID